MAFHLTVRGPEGQYQNITADRNLVFVGRREGNDVVLPYAFVSGRHCRIFRHGTRNFVEDVGSTNGILVNGESVPSQTPHALQTSDVIQIGRVEIRVQWVEEAEVIVAPEATVYESAEPGQRTGPLQQIAKPPVGAPAPAAAAQARPAAPIDTDSPATMWEIQTGVYNASSMQIDDHRVGTGQGNVVVPTPGSFAGPAPAPPVAAASPAVVRSDRFQIYSMAFQAVGLATLFGAIVLLVFVLLS